MKMVGKKPASKQLTLPPRPGAVNFGLTVEDLKARVIGKRIVDVVIQGAGTDWAYVDGVILEGGTRLECWERKGVAWLQCIPNPSNATMN